MAAVLQVQSQSRGVMLGTGDKVAVVGLGKTGLSALRFLHRAGIECLAVDTRDAPPGLEEAKSLAGVPVFTGGLRSDMLAWATHLLVSPGIGLDQPDVRAALERGAGLISDIDLFAQAVTAPVIAVTGSNGKSTVTTLVTEMATQAGIKAKAGGNLGTPVLDMVAEDCGLYVVELSSFQLERTRKLRPQVGAILNISPDHLDRYESLADYAAVKGRLFELSKICVANGDDSRVQNLAKKSGCHQVLNFGVESGFVDFGLQVYEGETWLTFHEQKLIPGSEVALQGRHNLANALAALALGEAAGIPMPARLKALRQFQGLPHRMQKVAESGGVVWINDSKGTNVGATVAAITGLPGPVILLAGGEGKGADFTPLSPVAKNKVKIAILFGHDKGKLQETLADATETILVEDLDEAVTIARQKATPGDTVLLSPACASQDQFNNYEDRGNRFIELVRSFA